ncbi:hypothetical protein EVAR_17148_1 [Eumeta japonica]|uniref:Uncharacterized protein n=1 Tax=Eumeta variegata TaxID=151549 RepID=A0A4C1UN78_EUMVA|nr:hypothetical protein EVAR_17148_1 [Eumeta japonica]
MRQIFRLRRGRTGSRVDDGLYAAAWNYGASWKLRWVHGEVSEEQVLQNHTERMLLYANFLLSPGKSS